MANINDRINGQEFESASPLAHAVRYDRAQVKTEEQKKQARENIGCYCEAGGGGGSSGNSSGGGVFVVHAEEDDATGKDRLDKTAAEILEASKTMLVMQVNHNEYEDEEETSVQTFYMGNALKEDNNYNFKFYYNVPTEDHCIQYRAANDDDYPLLYNSDEDGDEPIS